MWEKRGVTKVLGFLFEHADTFLYGSLVAVLSWFAINMIGKPIVALRDTRIKALRVAERYAYFGSTSTQSIERIREVKRELFDVASELRVQARGYSRLARWYCRFLRYDLEEAASALRGLGEMAGEDYSEQVRTNNLNHVYISYQVQS